MKILEPIEFKTLTDNIAGEVDRESGIIRGVSVITGGVTAKGHNLEVDATTLSQMKALGVKRGKVPTKWNHKTGADAVNGHLFNFRIVGKKLKADWKLLKSHAMYEQVLELAEEQPDTVGLSASFMGDNEQKGDKEFARCSELLSVDLVATAAANPDGLFEVPVDSPPGSMAKTIPAPGEVPAPQQPVTLEAVLAAVTGLGSAVTSLGERMTNFEAALEADEEEDEEEEDPSPAPAAAAEGRQFNSLAEVVQYFESKMDEARSEQERHDFEAAHQALEAKVGQLLELNQQLLVENEAIAGAYKMLSEKTKATVEFQAGHDGVERPVVQFPAATSKQTDFEKRTAELVAGGKKKTEAITFAINEDEGRYAQHLTAKGIVAQEL